MLNPPGLSGEPKELFDSCYSRLYYIAYGILGNPDMAEDIVEETFFPT